MSHQHTANLLLLGRHGILKESEDLRTKGLVNSTEKNQQTNKQKTMFAVRQGKFNYNESGTTHCLLRSTELICCAKAHVSFAYCV